MTPDVNITSEFGGYRIEKIAWEIRTLHTSEDAGTLYTVDIRAFETPKWGRGISDSRGIFWQAISNRTLTDNNPALIVQ